VDTALKICLPRLLEERKYLLTDEDSKQETVWDGEITLTFEKPRTARLLWLKRCK